MGITPPSKARHSQVKYKCCLRKLQVPILLPRESGDGERPTWFHGPSRGMPLLKAAQQDGNRTDKRSTHAVHIAYCATIGCALYLECSRMPAQCRASRSISVRLVVSSGRLFLRLQSKTYIIPEILGERTNQNLAGNDRMLGNHPVLCCIYRGKTFAKAQHKLNGEAGIPHACPLHRWLDAITPLAPAIPAHHHHHHHQVPSKPIEKPPH